MPLESQERFEWENDLIGFPFSKGLSGCFGEVGYKDQTKNRGSFQEAFSVVMARNDWLLTGVEETWLDRDIFCTGGEVLIGVEQVLALEGAQDATKGWRF